MLKLKYKEGQKASGNKYTMLIPDGFIIEKDDERDFIAWYPNPDKPECKEDAIIVIYPGIETNVNLGFEVQNPRVWEIYQEFLFWNGKSNFGEIFSQNKFFPISAKYVSGGCNFLPGAQIYNYILSVHIEDISKNIRVDVKGVTKENEEIVEKMICDLADGIKPQRIKRVNNSDYIIKLFENEILKHFKKEINRMKIKNLVQKNIKKQEAFDMIDTRKKELSIIEREWKYSKKECDNIFSSKTCMSKDEAKKALQNITQIAQRYRDKYNEFLTLFDKDAKSFLKQEADYTFVEAVNNVINEVFKLIDDYTYEFSQKGKTFLKLATVEYEVSEELGDIKLWWIDQY